MAAVAENTNIIGRLVNTVENLNEAQDKKVEAMKSHFAKKERFYDQRNKYYEEKLKILQERK